MDTYISSFPNGETLDETINEKMTRVVLTLTRSGNTYTLKNKDNVIVNFATLKDLIDDESNYVVVLYGQSKLRPQYVSANEIHCDGEDFDSDGVFFLRMLMTPTSLSYQRLDLANETDTDEMREDIDNLNKDLTELVDAESTVVNLEFTIGQYTITTNTNTVLKSSSQNWKGAETVVEPNEVYKISTTIYGTSYYAVIFADEDNYVLEKYDIAESSKDTNVTSIVKVPDGASKMFVNYHINDIMTNPNVRNLISVKSISDLSEKIAEVSDNLSSSLDVTTISGNARVNGDDISFGSSDTWKYADINVSKGRKFKITTTIYGSTYYGIIFAKNKKLIAAYEIKGSNVEETIIKEIEVPENATRMYINCRTGYNISVKEYISIATINDSTKVLPFTICSVNCGTFDHFPKYKDKIVDDEGNPDWEVYLSNWKKMINNTKFDIFALVDCPFSTTSTIFNENNMFKPICDNSTSIQDKFFEFRNTITNAELLTVTSSVTVDGHTYSNPNRSKFLRSVYKHGSLSIAIYAIHASPQLSDGYEHLRKQQFLDLIDDSKNYDGAVFVGDFNCQNAEEYKVFTDNGFKIANCGYLGTTNTLRDIPADNIIVSEYLNIDFFRVIDEFNLNTDHYPVIAQIR